MRRWAVLAADEHVRDVDRTCRHAAGSSFVGPCSVGGTAIRADSLLALSSHHERVACPGWMGSTARSTGGSGAV